MCLLIVGDPIQQLAARAYREERVKLGASLVAAWAAVVVAMTYLQVCTPLSGVYFPIESNRYPSEYQLKRFHARTTRLLYALPTPVSTGRREPAPGASEELQKYRSLPAAINPVDVAVVARPVRDADAASRPRRAGLGRERHRHGAGDAVTHLRADDRVAGLLHCSPASRPSGRTPTRRSCMPTRWPVSPTAST